MYANAFNTDKDRMFLLDHSWVVLGWVLLLDNNPWRMLCRKAVQFLGVYPLDTFKSLVFTFFFGKNEELQQSGGKLPTKPKWRKFECISALSERFPLSQPENKQKLFKIYNSNDNVSNVNYVCPLSPLLIKFRKRTCCRTKTS